MGLLHYQLHMYCPEKEPAKLLSMNNKVHIQQEIFTNLLLSIENEFMVLLRFDYKSSPQFKVGTNGSKSY